MLTLIVGWLYIFWLSLVVGIGGSALLSSLNQHALVSVEERSPDLIILFGFAIITVFTSYLSIFIPIDWTVKAGSIVVGIILTSIYFSKIKAILSRAIRSLRNLALFFKVLAGLFITIALLEGVDEITLLDTKIYHMQAVQWIREYAVVPGLGNLHGRFAFNAHFFIVSALFTIEISDNLIVYPVNSALFVVLSVRLITNIDTSVKQQDWFNFVLNFLLLILVPYLCLKNLSSLSTDIVSCVIIVFMFLVFLSMSQRRDNFFKSILLALLVPMIVTFKLSSITIGILLVFLLIPFHVKRLLTFALIGIIVILPFLYRNYILSGYLLYPYPGLDMVEAEWKIPQEQVIFERQLVETWAIRTWDEHLSEEEVVEEYSNKAFEEWFFIWWNRFKKWKIILIINLISIIPFVISFLKRDYRISVLFFITISALSFWFSVAPDPRFAYGFILFNCALTLAYGLLPLLRRLDLKGIYAYGMVGLAVLFLGVYQLRISSDFPGIRGFSSLVYPAPVEGTRATPLEAENFTVNVAVYCGHTPLPCTPYPRENLALRGEGFQDGFVVLEE